MFGDRLPLAERYAHLLAAGAAERGLIGPGEARRLWSRHLLNSAVVADLLPARSFVVDVGSGAGLPGLPLAIARADLRLLLVDAMARRAGWLSGVVDDLGLDNVVVRQARAEDLVRTVRADAVTARAVAPLSRLLGWCLPLLRPGGQLLALKGRNAEQEIADSRPVLRDFAVTSCDVVRCGEGLLDEPTTVVRVVAGTATARDGPSAGGRRAR